LGGATAATPARDTARDTKPANEPLMTLETRSVGFSKPEIDEAFRRADVLK
jgi:hypothetical protein